MAIGMYIPGGQPIFGKFKSLKSCAAACSKNPTCFAADYDKWLHKCYMHTNVTACANQQTHPSITHLSKVPCRKKFLLLLKRCSVFNLKICKAIMTNDQGRSTILHNHQN